jgi:ADP-heptose:LPS heptosyltransferase
VRFKGLERIVKRGAFGIAGALARGNNPSVPDWSSGVHRILFLRYDRIGDMLMLTPLIRAIATAYPSIEIDVVASPSNHPVLAGNPNVRRVHVFDRRSLTSYARTVRALRALRYDAVVSGMLKASATTSALMIGSGSPLRIGIADEKSAFAYSVPVPPASPGSQFARQLGEILRVFGVDPDSVPWHYDLFLSEGERSQGEALWGPHSGMPRVLVNVSAFTEDRRWQPERYVAVIRHIRLRRPDAALVVTGDPRDWAAAEGVAAAAGAAATNVSPIRNAFAFVAAADLLVTPDTSLAHAASAEGIPAVIMFRSGAGFYAPPGGNNACVMSTGTLAELPVEAVTREIDRMLARF